MANAIDGNVENAINSFLKLQTNNTLIWNCPDRMGLPAPGLPSSAATSYGSGTQWYIGYAYFGGVSAWANASSSKNSYSPVKLASAKPFWTLSADPNFKVGTGWAGAVAAKSFPTWVFEYGNIPPHPAKGGGGNPAGGDEVFADGSGQWCKFGGMYKFNSYPGAIGQIDAYWYQDPTDFDVNLLNGLPNMK